MQQDEQELLQQLSGASNAEQLQKFKLMQEQHRQHMRQGMRHGADDGSHEAPQTPPEE